MELKDLYFVGGSRNGERIAAGGPPSVTFVDGYLSHTDPQGALSRPMNATIETYVLERMKVDGDGQLPAYFLADLDLKERQERLLSLLDSPRAA